MKQTERRPDFEEALREFFDWRQSEMWTSMPGVVDSYNAETQTASVIVAVQGTRRQADNSYTPETITVLGHCPVQFLRGGGFAVTVPIVKGDEGLLVFASRCIDSWWEQGAAAGIPPRAEFRMHSLSDGFFLPGVCSKPRALSAVSGNSAQIRNADGSVFVEVQAGKIKLKGVVEIDGDVKVIGKVDASDEITAKAGTANSVTVTGHKHVETGSTTNAPTPGT